MSERFYRPILSQYWVRTVVQEDRTPGGVWLPDIAKNDTDCDAVVIGAGPGDGNGMQAKPGDRVLFLAKDFRNLDEDPREGFVRDEAIVATIPAPDYQEVVPENDYVLIQRDPWPLTWETSGKILVSRDTLRSGYSRWLERGEELHGELSVAVERHFRQSGQVNVSLQDKMDYCGRLFQSLPPEEQAAVRESVERKGETEWEYYHSPSSAKRSTRGTILAIPKGFDFRVPEMAVGRSVHWDRLHERVVLGNDRILVKAEYLAAIEV
jgi:co-chaperonin GroES (HSP10)